MYYFCTRKQANGVVVQLVRMPACHAGGREFESRPYRKIPEILLNLGDFDFMYVELGTRDLLSLPYQGEAWRGCQNKDREPARA